MCALAITLIKSAEEVNAFKNKLVGNESIADFLHCSNSHFLHQDKAYSKLDCS
jgi:hypothetical protein